MGWLYLEVSCVDVDGGAWLMRAGLTLKCPVLMRMVEPGWYGLALPGSVLC